jgi:hypothetical protein
MGWNLVRHSFVLLFNNLGNALKVSVGPFLILIAFVFVLTLTLGFSFDQIGPGAAMTRQLPAEAAGGAFLGILLFLLAALFVFAWVAVSWHRFVLLEEYPGLLPTIADRPIWPYIGRSILLALILVLIAIPVGFVFGLLVSPLMGNVTLLLLLTTLMGVFFTWIWLRLALLLPGTAVGKPISMGDAWSASGRLSGPIFQAAVILVALNVLVSFVFGTALGGNIVGDILNLIVSWVTMMVGISMLTTLYGHLIEGRELPN